MAPSALAAERSGTSNVGPAGRPIREACLRAEFSALYPAIRPGQWEPAAVLADRLLADLLLRGSGGAIRGRALVDAHFEFRGGTSRGGEREGMRFRREERCGETLD